MLQFTHLSQRNFSTSQMARKMVNLRDSTSVASHSLKMFRLYKLYKQQKSQIALQHSFASKEPCSCVSIKCWLHESMQLICEFQNSVWYSISLSVLSIFSSPFLLSMPFWYCDSRDFTETIRFSRFCKSETAVWSVWFVAEAIANFVNARSRKFQLNSQTILQPTIPLKTGYSNQIRYLNRSGEVFTRFEMHPD